MNALDLSGTSEPEGPVGPRMVRQRDVPQGQMMISDAPDVELVATLGSCVSVCLHARARGIGGMNHVFQTVHDRPGGDAAVVAELEALVNLFMRRGLARGDLTARLAGGAHLLSHGRDYGLDIARAALDYLAGEAIPVVGLSIGGGRARRVRFHTFTGNLSIKLLAPPRALAVKPPSTFGNAPEMF
jgi:chemotaxis protein CheD